MCIGPPSRGRLHTFELHYWASYSFGVGIDDLVISGEVFKVYFDESVDLNLIKDNLTKKQDKLYKDLENVSKKLDNKSFIERAPKHIVEQEKNTYNELKSDIDKINVTIESLK